jgi:Ni/Co efflux regulator RcnB
MAILIPPHMQMSYPVKRHRRSATTVIAGEFDLRPSRDALTSLLNGVGRYALVENEEDTRRTKKREKRDRHKERKRTKAATKTHEKSISMNGLDAIAVVASIPPAVTSIVQPPATGMSSFWRGRPSIHIATMQRSVSVTPPPMPRATPIMPSSPASTPGPSSSSSTSRTSSKRPRTPHDDEDLDRQQRSSEPATQQHTRKKRTATRKGWKGWVEGSPPPSEKLINLDAVPVLQERRTRSGKSFDAIGVGKEGWV